MDVDPDGATWRKSTYSNGGGGNCVEVADLPNGQAVRDSKHPQGPILVFTTDQWRAFVHGIAWGMSSTPFAFAPTGTRVFVVGELEQ